MNTNENLLDMIAAAMLAQRKSFRAYEIIVNAAPNQRDKELLRTIRREERRHYYFLEGIYEDLTGEQAKPQRVAISLPKFYPDMLKTAICDKLEVIDHLEMIVQVMNCVRQKELMSIIISDQKEHARILASIYGRIGK